MDQVASKTAEIVQPRLSIPYSWNQSLEETSYAPTVLIVDDLEINRRLLKAMLRSTNYRFLEARRANDALHILETEPVDLVILDLMIPGLSGPEFCRHVKNNRKTKLVPVLMITSLHGVENDLR